MKNSTWVWLYGQVCVVIGALGMFLVGYINMPGEPEGIRTIHTYTVVGEDLREEVKCEWDEPLKYITLIMNYYDTNEEMYADYILLAEPVKHEEIWGWSNCSWQPEDSWAACDIYVVKPDFVHADMNIDTIGHEVEHATCGDYHD